MRKETENQNKIRVEENLEPQIIKKNDTRQKLQMK